MENEHARSNAKAWAQQIDAQFRDHDALPMDADTEREQLMDLMREWPLTVQVRSGWTDPGQPLHAEAYCLLLTTGGPALRIVGGIDEYGTPDTARMEYQDWGIPWTEYRVTGEGDVLLRFAQLFYYGC